MVSSSLSNNKNFIALEDVKLKKQEDKINKKLQRKKIKKYKYQKNNYEENFTLEDYLDSYEIEKLKDIIY